MEIIAGYTIFNDVTARNMQKVDIENRNPWFRSKSLDTFGPLGPWVVTPDELGNPHHLNLTCRVNGEIRQQSNTQNMMFRIPELIEYITRMITLEPGDIVVTGTPEGISAMYPGDVVECEIENIGVLSNPIVAENSPAP
jgi:2-keto-4-pentenoate hydratase/2-oxohepta-3-ene-1,7-dioic acid hydratase in catechol pathway